MSEFTYGILPDGSDPLHDRLCVASAWALRIKRTAETGRRHRPSAWTRRLMQHGQASAEKLHWLFATANREAHSKEGPGLGRGALKAISRIAGRSLCLGSLRRG